MENTESNDLYIPELDYLELLGAAKILHPQNHDDHWENLTCKSGTTYRLNAWDSDAYGDCAHGQCVTAYLDTEDGIDTSKYKRIIESRPIGAECRIQLRDDSTESDVYISFGAFTEHHQHDGYGVNDDSIYYYASAGESELKALTLSANADDFVILNYDLVYEWPTKATYGNNGFAIPNDVGNYKVQVMRSASESCELFVKAGSEESAREQALLMVKSDDFTASSWKLDDEIGSIQDVVVTKCS